MTIKGPWKPANTKQANSRMNRTYNGQPWQDRTVTNMLDETIDSFPKWFRDCMNSQHATEIYGNSNLIELSCDTCERMTRIPR